MLHLWCIRGAFIVIRLKTLLILAAVCLTALPLQTPAQDQIAIIPVTELVNSNGATIRSASYDGKRIVFESNNNYTGENADANFEIFVFDVDSRKFIQITKTENLKDPADATKTTLVVSSNAPNISGDGTKIVFSSNAKLTAAANDDGNQEIFLASLPRGSETATFTRITDTGPNDATEVVKEIFSNFAANVSADGSVIAFVSSRRTFAALENGTAAFTASLEGPNRDQVPDANNEIFLYFVLGRQYKQVTVSRDVDATENFVVKGFNNNPVLSGNGQVMAFLSAFNYPGTSGGNNLDFNGEIFIFRTQDPANTFRQLTATTGTAAVPANGPNNIMVAFARSFDFSGNNLVFESAADLSGTNADKTREIFLANLSGAAPVFRQVTNQTTADAAKSDFSFIPSINGDGTFITFGSTLNLVPTMPSAVATDNADGSRDLFRYDIAASTPTAPVFKQLTFTSPASFLLDQRFNTSFSYPDQTGRRVSFNYISTLLAVNSSFASEIFQLIVLPVSSTNAQAVTLVNAATFDNTQVARGSIAAAFGTQLANTTAQPTNLVPVFELQGVSVTIAGIAAQLLFISPGQINLVVPNIIAIGDTVDVKVVNNGILSSGKVKIVTQAPGLFSAGIGSQTAAAQCGEVLDMVFVITEPPCAASVEAAEGVEAKVRFLILYGTGWRNASASTTVTLGETVLTPVFAGAQGFFPGFDQINVGIPAAAAGKGDLPVKVTSAGIVSNTLMINIK